MSTNVLDPENPLARSTPFTAKSEVQSLLSQAAAPPAGVAGRAVKADLKFVAAADVAPRVHVESANAPTRYEGRFALLPVAIHDGWPQVSEFTLDRNGFEFAPHVSAVTDFENEDEVERVYYPEVEALVKAATGASRVLIFDATVRKDGNGSGRTPARHVHVDYTERSAPKRIRDFVGEAEADALLAKRHVQVNVWRSIRGTVQRSPLAFLDAQTLRQDDLIRTELVNGSRVGEIYSLRFDPGQRWYYFPRMTENETVLIKGYDSADGWRARFTPHTAFDDPTTPTDAPPRESIEVRTFAFFDA